MPSLPFSSKSLLLPVVVFSLSACLGGGGSSEQSNRDAEVGKLAAKQSRYLASELKGRMAGTPQEEKAAAYLTAQFKAMGYTDVSEAGFPVAYTFCLADKTCNADFKAESRNVIAVKKGRSNKVVIVGAHYDSRPSTRLSQVTAGVGGADLQGVDDNASGVGVLLELAKRLKDINTEYTIKFVAFGAEEVGLKGSKAYVTTMSEADKANTVLMVNMDSLITGDHLYFHAGASTVAVDAKAGFARDRALAIAKALDIKADTNPGLNTEYPKGTGCCSDQESFDAAGMPVLAVEATNWYVGDKDGYQQVADDKLFSGGSTWHEVAEDNIATLDSKLPQRIEQRSRDITRILKELITEAANGKIHP